MRTIAIAILTMVSVACTTARSAAPKTDRAPKTKTGPYTFKPAYKSGEKVLLVHATSMVTQMSRAGNKEEQTIGYQTELLVTVSKGDAAGQQKLDCTIHRVCLVIKIPSRPAVNVDTAKPETIKGAYAGVKKLLTDLAFDAVLTRGQNVSGFTGKGTYYTQVLKSIPANMPADEKKKLLSPMMGPYEDILTSQWAYLPAKPVRIGDTWTVKRETFPTPIIGGTRSKEEKVTCKLKRVSIVKGERIAEISVAGTVMIANGLPNPRQVTLKRTGTVTFNLTTGKLMKLILTSKGKPSPSQSATLTTELKLVKPPVSGKKKTGKGAASRPKMSSGKKAPA